MKQDILNLLSPLNVGLFLFFIFLLIKRSMLLRLLILPWSIFYHWTRTIKVLFSTSLSPKEQSIFEEQFKYLIVTSSVFNELNQQQQQQQMLENAPQTTEGIGHLFILTISLLYSVTLLATCYYYYHDTLICGLLISYLFTCYFIYRHNKHVQVRKIHASALDSMHEIISLSQKSDTALATLSANTQRLIPIIKPHLETYTQLINQLKPLTDSQNLCRLRDMYMDKLQDVDLLITSIRSKRRDYFLHLLALDVMSNNQAAHYGKNWKRAIQINRQLVLEYQKFNKQLAQVVSSEPLTVMTGSKGTKSLSLNYALSPSSPMTDISLSENKAVDLIQKVAAIERYMEECQSKLFACRQDMKYLSYGRGTVQSLNRINTRFTSVDDTLVKLSARWEESKTILKSLLAEQEHKDDTTLPSPPSSPVHQEISKSLSLNHGTIRKRNRNSYFF
ncbi:unnamed protein product [Rhizopus microsporus]